MARSSTLVEDIWYGFHLLFLIVVLVGTSTLLGIVEASDFTLVIVPFVFTTVIVVLRRISLWLGPFDEPLLGTGRAEVHTDFLNRKLVVAAAVVILVALLGIVF